MRDEDFEAFIDKFGEASHQEFPSASDIERWEGKLPDQLLTYWKQEGFAAYGDGLFWVVNPSDYEDTVTEWLRGSPLNKVDRFHVMARSAFGKLYLWGERTGSSVKIAPSTNAIIALSSNLKRSIKDPDFAIRTFFSGRAVSDADLKDEEGSLLFKRILSKAGPLSTDEMYGFNPALVAGGRMKLENLEKLNIFDHLAYLRQLAKPELPFADIDISNLI